jgi:NMD protein affecting ribosome stability and mRNA decay
MPDKANARNIRRLRRGNPGLREEIHDPYRSRRKSRAPAACPECGAVYVRGRWSWKAPGASQPGEKLVCPACRRITERYPAGEVRLSGAFAIAHGSEALRLVENIARTENREHPLNRVMRIRRQAAEIVIETTDLHLPRRIGHAVEAAWGGKLQTHYDEQGCFVRVAWRRDD